MEQFKTGRAFACGDYMNNYHLKFILLKTSLNVCQDCQLTSSNDVLLDARKLQYYPVCKCNIPCLFVNRLPEKTLKLYEYAEVWWIAL